MCTSETIVTLDRRSRAGLCGMVITRNPRRVGHGDTVARGLEKQGLTLSLEHERLAAVFT
jgi:hypothetical protein